MRLLEQNPRESDLARVREGLPASCEWGHIRRGAGRPYEKSRKLLHSSLNMSSMSLLCRAGFGHSSVGAEVELFIIYWFTYQGQCTLINIAVNVPESGYFSVPAQVLKGNAERKDPKVNAGIKQKKKSNIIMKTLILVMSPKRYKEDCFWAIRQAEVKSWLCMCKFSVIKFTGEEESNFLPSCFGPQCPQMPPSGWCLRYSSGGSEMGICVGTPDGWVQRCSEPRLSAAPHPRRKYGKIRDVDGRVCLNKIKIKANRECV